MFASRLVLACSLLIGSLPPAIGAADFDSQDPVRWALLRLQETPEGPKLKLWEPREPARRVPRTRGSPGLSARVRRNADGTLRDPRHAFPDGDESQAVLDAVDAFLALGRRAPEELRRRAFSAVAGAAERWARSWVGEPPQGLNRREARRFVREIAMRMITNPAVPRFNELIDPGMPSGVAAETGFDRGWRTWRGKAGWRLGPRDDSPLSVTYDDSPLNSLASELTRLHEWVHVVDEARLGTVDGEGRQVREVPENRAGLFMEAKAYAIDYLLQRAFLADDDCSLQDAAEELGKELSEVSFEEYLLYEVGRGGIYPWASALRQPDPKAARRERAQSKRFERKERARALRHPTMRYLRTIVP